jgi:hypothetical protein
MSSVRKTIAPCTYLRKSILTIVDVPISVIFIMSEYSSTIERSSENVGWLSSSQVSLVSCIANVTAMNKGMTAARSLASLAGDVQFSQAFQS